MKKFQAHFPMALDESHHRLFIGYRKPARLVVFDTATGKPVNDLAISGDTDDLFYDTRLRRLYISCGDGFVDVIAQQEADQYKVLEKIPTRAGARTSFWSGDLKEFTSPFPRAASNRLKFASLPLRNDPLGHLFVP